MDPIGRESKLRKNPRVVYRHLAEHGGGVLLHLDSGQYHAVNETGSAIWELLDGHRTVGEVAEELSARVSDPPSEVDRDVELFLTAMRERGLVVR